MLRYNEIAVIDDGINRDFYANIPVIKKSLEIDMDCNIAEYRNNEMEYSHGTECAAIISKYAEGITMNSVKIINESDKTTGRQLIKAIEWCLENNIGIVNLSLGTTDINEKKDIRRIINKAISYGMIIVAASSNNDKITYPASFSNVIGVKTLRDQSEYEGYLYNCNSIDGVDILAPSVHKLINYYEEEESGRCNSFAAPYITAEIYNIIKKSQQKYTPLEIKYMLLEKAINYKKISEKNILNQHLEWVCRAVIFNIGRDKSFNTRNEAYIFDIVEEKYIYEEDGLKSLEVIEEILNKKNLKDYDTIVIKDYNDKFNLNFFAENLFNYRKGLVYINDSCKEKESLNVAYKNNIWFTGIYKCFTSKLKVDANIDIPVILIVGESETEIQNSLKLAEAFKLKDYRCGLYSDISSCELYGMDYLPLKDLYCEEKLKSHRLKSILNSSEIDLAILFIDAYKVDINYIKCIEESLENDIRIAINHDISKFFSYDEDKYSINLINKDNVASKLVCGQKVYVAKDIEDLYNYIIEIYS
jgi:hypothetical protein